MHAIFNELREALGCHFFSIRHLHTVRGSGARHVLQLSIAPPDAAQPPFVVSGGIVRTTSPVLCRTSSRGLHIQRCRHRTFT